MVEISSDDVMRAQVNLEAMTLLLIIALAAAPDESAQLAREARTFIKERKLTAAREKAERCTARDPKATRCWLVLTHALTLEAKPAQARAAFERYLALVPNPPSPTLRGGHQIPAVDYP